MKQFIKNKLKRLFPENNMTNKGIQILLSEHYRQLLENKIALPSFDRIEFRNYSQNGEDGILLFIFSLIGEGNKRCVEICAGDGKQCNTTNLILNFGWNALLFDGNPSLVKMGIEFFNQRPEISNLKPTFISAWITKDNVNELIMTNGFEGEVDLLSLDIDGNDYWILDAISCISPRVILLEYQCIWGDDCSVSIPYDPLFKAGFDGKFGIYCGASLPAFVKLLKSKGYRLIGCEDNGYNAFFMRNDVGTEVFPEIDAKECIEKPFVHFARKNFLDKIKKYNWVDV
jgi:hypothetical protein